MKIKELKDKILIAELDPSMSYICLVNPAYVKLNTLRVAWSDKHLDKRIPFVIVGDVDKSIRLVEIKKIIKK